MDALSLIFAREATAAMLAPIVRPCEIVTNRADYVAAVAKYSPAIAYVDFDLVPQIRGHGDVTVVAVIDGGLDAIVAALDAMPWVSHFVTSAMLSTPYAAAQLAALADRLRDGAEYSILGPDGVGRAALLTHSARRESRLERMRGFFETHEVSSRMVSVLSDIAEELVTNALYDAPAEAGFFASAVPRTEDIELPTEHACEISYGIEGKRAFVRMRDPFGALSRTRILDVLKRCNSNGVVLDESRGGAGLGLWRLLSSASTISITVIPGRLTDILVWLNLAKSRTPKQLLAAHLFFPEGHALDGAQSWFAADHDCDLLDESFTALTS